MKLGRRKGKARFRRLFSLKKGLELALNPSDWDIEFEIMADEIRQSGIRMVRLDLEVAGRRKEVRLEGIIIGKLRKSIAMGIEETNEKCCYLFIFPFLLNNYSMN